MECDLKALLRPFLLSYYSDTSFLRCLYMMKFLPFLLSFSFSSFLFSFVLFVFHVEMLEKCEIFFTLLLVKFNLHRWDSCFFFTCATFLTFVLRKKNTQTDNTRKEIKLKMKFYFNSHLEYLFFLLLLFLVMQKH